MRVLHLEDSLPDAELIAARLAVDWPGCDIHRASSREQFEAALHTGDFDLILSDYTLHGYDGLSALDLARTQCPDKPFIFLSGTIGEERAIEALKRGATDYVIKDRPSRLVPAIRQAMARAEEEHRLRRIEEALRQSRDRFRQIAENVADLIIMVDASAHCLYCNPAYATAVGRPAESRDHDALDDVHPGDREAVWNIVRTALRTGESNRAEYRLVQRGGTVRHVEGQASAIRDRAGTVTQVLVVARDLADRQAAVEHIQQRATLLDEAHDAILLRDLQDRVTCWNRSASRVYGWPDQEPRNRSVSELWTEDPVQVEIARNATMSRGEWMGEMHERSFDGVELIVLSRWSLLRQPDGAAAGFLIINTNIAEKKRIEAQALRDQRMEGIRMLAGGIAHDLNNVLLPIMASTELVESSVVTAEGRQCIASIRSSAERGAEFVRQLLAFAQGNVCQKTVITLRPLLADFVGFLTRMFPPSIQVQLEAEEEPWPVSGDAAQLKQMLTQLCLNARDAMPEGGRITVGVRNVVVSDAEAASSGEIKPGPHAVISVDDTGMGMSPALVERIFDPFFTTKELGRGIGLGLAAVRGIVRSHDGRIVVDSRPGSGSTFRIFLPARCAESRARPAPADERAAQGAGETLLLIDDDDSVRNVLSTVLMASGYGVLKAASMAEGLQVFTAHRDSIRLVLTDVMMPDGDGFTVVRRIRELNGSVPMLIMSGLAAAGNYEQQAEELNVPLLAKPLTREELVRAVQGALEAATSAAG